MYLIQIIDGIIRRNMVPPKRNCVLYLYHNTKSNLYIKYSLAYSNEYKEKFLPISYYHCVKVLVYSRWSDTLTYYLWIYEQISSYGTRSHASYCSKFARWCNIRKQQFGGHLFSQEWVSKTNTRWAKPSQMRSQNEWRDDTWHAKSHRR